MIILVQAAETMDDLQGPVVNELLPEERLAKVVKILGLEHDFSKMSITEIAALLSPYIQMDLEEVAHQERILCLSDFYNLREKLMQRERASFQKKSELLLQIVSRPEADALGIRAYGGKDVGKATGG